MTTFDDPELERLYTARNARLMGILTAEEAVEFDRQIAALNAINKQLRGWQAQQQWKRHWTPAYRRIQRKIAADAIAPHLEAALGARLDELKAAKAARLDELKAAKAARRAPQAEQDM